MSNTDRTLKDISLESCHGNIIEKVRHCIGLEVDVNCVSDDGLWSGLAIAARNNYLELSDLLLSCRAIDVNLRTDSRCKNDDDNEDDDNNDNEDDDDNSDTEDEDDNSDDCNDSREVTGMVTGNCSDGGLLFQSS